LVLSNFCKIAPNYDFVVVDLDNTLIDEFSYLSHRMQQLLRVNLSDQKQISSILKSFESNYTKFGNSKIFSRVKLEFDLQIDLSEFVLLLEKSSELDKDLIYKERLQDIKEISNNSEIVIATNGNKRIQLNKISTISSYLDFTFEVFYLEGMRKKPNPSFLIDLMFEKKYQANRTLMVGDSKSDELCAKLAGVSFFNANLWNF